MLPFLLAVATALAGEPVRYPADLGASVIDVSGYPADQRRVYEELFLPKCGECHSPARAVNAPFVELTAAERSELLAGHPHALDDPDLLWAGPSVWRAHAYRMGLRKNGGEACPNFTKDGIVAIWQFLVFDSRARKTGGAVEGWLATRRGLVARFQPAMKRKSPGVTTKPAAAR